MCNSTTQSSTSGTSSAPTSAPTSAPVTRTTTTTRRPTTSMTQSPQTFCVTPSCKTDLQKNTLWAHPDPHYYYQCVPHANGSYEPFERACGDGTVFHYKLQVCVWERDWEDPCADKNKPVPLRTTSAMPPPPPAKPKKGYYYPKKFQPWKYAN